MAGDFQKFFQTARGDNLSPYGYQCRLACGPGADPDQPETLRNGAVCQSQLINIPTGLGKTAAVVLAWLWNRVALPSQISNRPSAMRDPIAPWPRRLVYCLPMRTLVEQTRAEAETWLKNLGLSETVGLHLLMGGEDADEWDLHPEKNVILIGTQDMLLSRALNRGYGMSRYRWPMHFGLLNTDCLWVMDETQLMGVSVETSAQLDAFRAAWPVSGNRPTWWMSATLDGSRLATVDAKPSGWQRLTLDDDERVSGRPATLFTAQKSVIRCELSLEPATKADCPKILAALIVEKHQPGTLTLVVVNRVARAQEIFSALTTAGKKNQPALYDPARVALVHSRFRSPDRAKHEELLFGDGDRIVIATQAVEAGVDVSARLLITELAPWSSLVQRIGRCNRRAEFSDAEVLWLDIQPKDEKDNLCLPYSKDDLDQARTALSTLTDASPQTLRCVKVEESKIIRPILRRRDLMDLFDTTPDICGQDLDISRYIHDAQDNDVQFFWRDVTDAAPLETQPQAARDELCRIPIGDAAKFLKNRKTAAWQWNPLDQKWTEADKLRPGVVYLIAATSGGYSAKLGWTGDTKSQDFAVLCSQDGNTDSHDANPSSFTGHWLTLAQHTADVVTETDRITRALALEEADATALRTAAQWHDIGKAHPAFQAMLLNGDASRKGTLWAKSADKNGKCDRRGFRHELASALAWLIAGPSDAPQRDLVAYLIASHHGKVRLSIRSLPKETGDPQDPERLFARGIWQGDSLPALTLGDLAIPITTLDLRFMRMGESELGPSWLARTIAQRDKLGPFRLAFLETLLRAADARASAKNPLP